MSIMRTTTGPTWVTGLGPAIITASVAALGIRGPVLVEDFEDDTIDDRWVVLETEPTIMTVAEQNMRLEFPTAVNAGLDAVAGIIGNGWAVDATSDFALRIDAHADIPPVDDGEVAVNIALVFNGDIENVMVDDGFVVELGRDLDGPYIGYAAIRDGNDVEQFYGPVSETDLTFFLWYEAVTDTLSLSVTEFFDPDAAQVFGLRTQSGSDRIVMFIGAFADGDTPAVPGEDLHFDDFVIEDGTIVAVCPEDLDGNGVVEFADILVVLTAWGDCPGCPEDLDGSGVVDFADILVVLTAWGPCE